MGAARDIRTARENIVCGVPGCGGGGGEWKGKKREKTAKKSEVCEIAKFLLAAKLALQQFEKKGDPVFGVGAAGRCLLNTG
jgi:hypothetical protein